ncbi:MAG: polysaccharide deacetylase family protein [Flavobacteriaceae bacterium]
MVYCTHGIVRNFDNSVFIHKNMLDWDATENYLKTREKPFQSLELAISGKAEALTIDDNTQAAYDLAALAIRYGHEVTLFINPHNLVHRQGYSFVLLNLLIDSLPESIIEFNGKDFDCTSYIGKKRLRFQLKKVLKNPKNEQERTESIIALAKHWKLDLGSVPHHLNTLSINQIKELLEMGVRIENHGWDHVSINDWDREHVEHFINDSQKWLLENLGIKSSFFAVPFGEVQPISHDLNVSCKHWFLEDSTIKLGSIDASVYNRKSLHITN